MDPAAQADPVKLIVAEVLYKYSGILGEALPRIEGSAWYPDARVITR